MTPQKQPDVGVTYIHRRPTWTDNIYGSGLSFEQGQTRLVPAGIAENFLRHTDVFERAKADAVAEESAQRGKAKEAEVVKDDTEQQLSVANAKKDADRTEENAIMDLKDSVARMDAKQLVAYAHTNWKQELPAKMPVKAMRAQVVQFIDQFGV